MEYVIGLLVIIGCLLLYLLPTIVGRNKRNAPSILAVNLFLGWTFVGWVVALAWAVSYDAPIQPVQPAPPPAPPPPAPVAPHYKPPSTLPPGW